MENEKETQERIKFILNHLEDKKGTNVLVLDVSKFSNVTDFIVMADGFVNRHVSAMVKTLIQEVREKFFERPIRVEGLASGEWVLVDFGDIIVHVFLPDLRERYDLESLWSKGSKVTIS